MIETSSSKYEQLYKACKEIAEPGMSEGRVWFFKRKAVAGSLDN